MVLSFYTNLIVEIVAKPCQRVKKRIKLSTTIIFHNLKGERTLRQAYWLQKVGKSHWEGNWLDDWMLIGLLS